MTGLSDQSIEIKAFEGLFEETRRVGGCHLDFGLKRGLVCVPVVTRLISHKVAYSRLLRGKEEGTLTVQLISLNAVICRVISLGKRGETRRCLWWLRKGKQQEKFGEI